MGEPLLISAKTSGSLNLMLPLSSSKGAGTGNCHENCFVQILSLVKMLNNCCERLMRGRARCVSVALFNHVSMCSKLRRHNNKSGKMEKSPSGCRGEGKVFLGSVVTLKVLVQNVQITNTVASEIFLPPTFTHVCSIADRKRLTCCLLFQVKFSFLSAEFSAYMEIMLRH